MYADFTERYDERYLADQFASKEELEEFAGKFRWGLVQLQDAGCGVVELEMVVTAAYAFGPQDVRFYDAVIDSEYFRRQSNDNSTSDVQERSLSQCKAVDWRAPAILLGFACLMSLGFFGVGTNLVIYLGSILHESNTSVAKNITNWAGASFLTPFLGALIADSYLGGYRTILFSSLIHFFGMITITLSASLPSMKPPPCNDNLCPSATEAQNLIFYSGLYLVAIGSGGVKSSLLPLGADQFDDENPVEREKRGSFFNWFYFCNNVGALVAGTVIVWAQENISWSTGYGICTFCMALAIVSFVCGTPMFQLHEPRGGSLSFNVLADFLRSFNSRVPIKSSYVHKDEDMEGADLNNEGTRDETHTSYDEFRRSPDSTKKKNKTSEIKMLVRLFPIWITGIFYSVAYAQINTTFIEQGKAMYAKVGSFCIPPASLTAFETASVMLWVLLYDKIFIATVRKLTHLQRMGIGNFIMILVMVVAAIVEAKRLKGVSRGEPVNILWQLPQYFVAAASEVFFFVGQLEFFYDQGPDSMRNLSTSISLLAISMGSYLSSVVVVLVSLATRRGDGDGWISHDLNAGHLDYFFWLLAIICMVNFVCYTTCARWYTLKPFKNVILDC